MTAPKSGAPRSFEVVECSIPERLTIADYRALRGRARRRRGLRALLGPAASVAANDRSKEVDMDAALAGRRGRRPWLAALATVALAGVLALALVEPSWAASNVGKRLGDEIETWGRAILIGIVGLVAIPVLAKRDVAGGAVVAMLAVVVGGFVFAPKAVQGVITGIWRALGG